MTEIKGFASTEETVRRAMMREITFADSPYFEQYTLQPYNPDELFQKKGNYDLHDDMRQDDQVSACLKLKKFIILNADWDVECEDEDLIEFIKYALTEGLDDIFQKKLYDILSALDYGFSVTEKVYAYVDTPNWGKKVLLTKMKTRAPHTFEFHLDKKGNIEELMQHVGEGPDIKVPLDKVIHYAYQKEFDNHYGRSEFSKGLYNAWWSKQALTKFLNIYLERFGMPTVVGTIPKSAPAQADRFLDVLKNIQAKTSMTMPEGFDVKLLDGRSGAANEVYIQAINYYNLMIGRSMLIPDLLGISGSETGGGSYALGKQQFDLFYTSIRFIRNDIERLINKEIIEPLVSYNFGDKKGVEVKFSFYESNKEAEADAAKLWLDAVKSGKVPTTNESINTFLAIVDMPEITDEEFEEIEAKAQEEKALESETMRAKAGLDPQSGKPMPIPKKGEPSERGQKQKPGEKKPAKKAEEKKTKKFAQDQEALEARAGIPKIKAAQDSLIRKYVGELGAVFKLAVAAMVDDIKRRRIVEKKRLDLINKVQFKHEQKLQKTLTSMMREAYSLGNGISVKKYEDDFYEGLDNEDVVSWLEENAIYVSDVEEENIIEIIKGELIEGIRGGMPPQKVYDNMNTALEGYNVVFPEEGPDRIEMIVRTGIAKAFNEARAQQFKTIEDEIFGYRFSAVMDERTSPICTALHGKTFKPEEILPLNPPLHPHCRSMLLPIFEDEEEYTVWGHDELPEIEKSHGWYKLKGRDWMEREGIPRLFFNPWHDEKGKFDFAPDGVGGGQTAERPRLGHRDTEGRPLGPNETAMAPAPRDDMIKSFKREFPGITDEQVEEYREALGAFTGSSYAQIRDIQRLGVDEFCRQRQVQGMSASTPDDEIVQLWAKDAKVIEDYIAKAPLYREETIYRGVEIGDPTVLQPGAEVEMHGTSSWSSDRNQYGWRNVEFVTTNRSGVSAMHYSAIPEEREVIHSKETRWKVTSVEKSTIPKDLYMTDELGNDPSGKLKYKVHLEELPR